MARKFFKRWLPAPEKMREHPSVRVFGSLLHDPNLWHLNRRSVTLAFFIGLFIAFVPIPTQMLLSALVAIMLRANLPLSVMLVWITNPVTMPAMFYFTYKIGALLLGLPHKTFVFELSWTWIHNELIELWQPFLLGCFVCGLFCGLLGASSIHVLWRVNVIRRWRKRQQERLARQTR
ncbi:DUF2062 domain-containing protein [Spongiibacter sp. KMU-158]|uniref:DUF2062 domain-containing protein n=1 Tax=Spongiibacter pelagi TaxID=2760804 RepID=A0A927GX49_9GAMM|nr:DUF2062 domain-containing protein [Spongiibacter pelagi]MBD2859069.1 DUF2062 domain-containing protein [Spongiibacter pelagi]